MTRRMSVDSNGKQAWAWCFDPQISADGRYIVFASSAENLVPGDTNQQPDIFVRDIHAHTTERVNVDSAGNQSLGASWFPSISADGGVVAFSSDASDLVVGDTNIYSDVFVHDRASGTTLRVSVDSAGLEADGASYVTQLLPLGRRQQDRFHSEADNLVPNDTKGRWDAFVHDVAAGTTVRANVDSAGGVDRHRRYDSDHGRRHGRPLHERRRRPRPARRERRQRLLRHDLVTGATDLISRDLATNSGDGASLQVVANRDGSAVAFASEATDLIAGDTNGSYDVFVFDRNVVPLRELDELRRRLAGTPASRPSLSARTPSSARARRSTSATRRARGRWRSSWSGRRVRRCRSRAGRCSSCRGRSRRKGCRSPASRPIHGAGLMRRHVLRRRPRCRRSRSTPAQPRAFRSRPASSRPGSRRARGRPLPLPSAEVAGQSAGSQSPRSVCLETTTASPPRTRTIGVRDVVGARVAEARGPRRKATQCTREVRGIPWSRLAARRSRFVSCRRRRSRRSRPGRTSRGRRIRGRASASTRTGRRERRQPARRRSGRRPLRRVLRATRATSSRATAAPAATFRAR